MPRGGGEGGAGGGEPRLWDAQTAKHGFIANPISISIRHVSLAKQYGISAVELL